MVNGNLRGTFILDLDYPDEMSKKQALKDMQRVIARCADECCEKFGLILEYDESNIDVQLLKTQNTGV